MLLYCLTQAAVFVVQVIFAIIAFTSPARNPLSRSKSDMPTDAAVSEHFKELSQQVKTIYHGQSCYNFRTIGSTCAQAAIINKTESAKGGRIKLSNFDFDQWESCFCSEEFFITQQNCIAEFDNLLGYSGGSITGSVGKTRESNIVESLDTLYWGYCRNDDNGWDAYQPFQDGADNLVSNYESHTQFPIRLAAGGYWNKKWFLLRGLEVPDSVELAPWDEVAPPLRLDFVEVSEQARIVYESEACTDMRAVWNDCDLTGQGGHDFSVNKTLVAQCLCPANATASQNEEHRYLDNSKYAKSLHDCTSAMDAIIHPDQELFSSSNLTASIDYYFSIYCLQHESDALVRTKTGWYQSYYRNGWDDTVNDAMIPTRLMDANNFPIHLTSGLWNAHFFYSHGLEAPKDLILPSSQSSSASRNGVGLRKMWQW